MHYRLVMILFFYLCAGCQSPQSGEGTAKEQLELYQGKVESIFFHPVVAFPEQVFNRNNKKGFKRSNMLHVYFNTVHEIKNILMHLYQRGYVLYEHENLFEKIEAKGQSRYRFRPIFVPSGKKPLLVSIDDLNYYATTRNNGMVHRLEVSESGELVAVVFNRKNEKIYYFEEDIILLFEQFIRQHPDFSFQGARGIIALTGVEGILGYPTQRLKSPYYPQYKTAALKVAEKLKQKGWRFASHSYGHINAGKVSFSRLKADTRRWKEEVEPLVGKTPYYVYAHGSFVPFQGEKIEYLTQAGFWCFFGVSYQAGYALKSGPYVYLERVPIDGDYVRGKYKGSRQNNFFELQAVIDPLRLEYDRIQGAVLKLP